MFLLINVKISVDLSKEENYGKNDNKRIQRRKQY